MQRGSRTYKFIKVNCLLTLKVNIVKNLGGLLRGGLKFFPDFINVKVVGGLITEYLKLVFEITDLVIVKPREGLELTRSEYLIPHSNLQLN